jgi:hypothetical protein
VTGFSCGNCGTIIPGQDDACPNCGRRQCQFDRANKYGWGRCRSEALPNDAYGRCEGHAKKVCAECGGPATQECSTQHLGNWTHGRESCDAHPCRE